LIVNEQKSIGRESFETNFTIKQLALAGVNVVEYVRGRSLIPKTWLDKAMVAVEAAADEAHREKTSERMWEAHKRLATRGYVTGARIYGYRNHDVFHGTDEHGRPLRSHVERVIEPPEAAVVRRIFALAAEGQGLKAIAKILNAEGQPSPRPRPGRPRAWAPSSVRCVLYRELYRGVNVWNKRRKSDSWGRLVTTMRPKSEWVVAAAMPHLQIVSDEEWTAAHQRLQTTRERYVNAVKRRTNGRPPSNVAAKYLLSGLMQCGWCGASMVVRLGKHGLGKRAHYICAGYNDRGRTVCENRFRLSMSQADDAILSKIRSTCWIPT
jgi:site-specific DNA recombinase